jgi:hypothetical protein
MPDTLALLTAFNDADLIWHNALIDVFGSNAGQARYEPRGRGEQGSPLRAAYLAREEARLAWEAAR